ncbi:hypothetical protein ES703_96861 [subsurface metagenome]
MGKRGTIDKEYRRAILDSRCIVQDLEKADGNEAETRRRVERIFESLMGYDTFKHLSRERAVRGAGETEHVDFAIQLESGEEAKPIIMVEIKRVNVDLAPKKHLKQISSYAINAGCEWLLLTNSKEWRLHHVAYGQPPETKHIFTWNLLTDDVNLLAERFSLLSYKSVRKGVLDDLWQKTNVLLPRNMLESILCENSIKVLRWEIRRKTSVMVSPEDIITALRRLLNETALAEMGDVKVILPERNIKQQRRKVKEEKPQEDKKAPEEEEPSKKPKEPT